MPINRPNGMKYVLVETTGLWQEMLEVSSAFFKEFGYAPKQEEIVGGTFGWVIQYMEEGAVMKIDRPPLKLVGENGNVFNIIGLAKKAARNAGWTLEEVKTLSEDLLSKHSYDDVLVAVMERFDVS